jgi:hypothetical protein
MANYTQEVNGDVSQTQAESSAGTFYTEVADGVTDGSTYNRNAAGNWNSQIIYELANIPADFSSLNSIKVRAYLNNSGWSNDSMSLTATITTAGGTPISNATAFADETTSGQVEITITGITAGSLANDNRLVIDWNYSKSGGVDGGYTSLYDLELLWDYNAATPTVTLSANLSGTGSISASINVKIYAKGVATNPQSSVLNDLIDLFPLDETSGNRTGVHAGTVLTDNNTVGSTTGVLGNAASFEESASEYLSGYSGAGMTTAQFSVMHWINNPASLNNYAYYFTKGSSNEGADEWKFYNRSASASGVQWQAQFSQDDEVTNDAVLSWDSDAHLASGWNSWFLVRDGANGKAYSVMNGDYKEVALTANTIPSTTKPLTIGGTLSGLFDTIQVDHVGFWSKSLTVEEIEWLDNSQSARSYNEFWVGRGSASVVSGTTKTLSATLSGAGSISSSLSAVQTEVAASLSGVGSISSNPTVKTSVQASLSGAGGLTAAIDNTVPLASSLSGTSNLSAAIDAKITFVANLSGAGGLSASLEPFTHNLQASLPSTGGLSASISPFTHNVSSTLPGVGGIAAVINNTVPVQASLSGVGSLAASIDNIVGLIASLTGAGTFAAALDNKTFISSTLPGTGGITVSIDVVTAGLVTLSATLQGTGSISSSIDNTVPLAASLPGVGAVSASLLNKASVSATLQGTSDLASTLGVVSELVATLSGVGGLSSSLDNKTFLSSTLPGTGNITVSIDVIGATPVVTLSAVLAGTGGINADIDNTVDLTVSLAGDSGLSSSIDNRVSLSANLPSIGDIQSTIDSIVILGATLVGQGFQTVSIDVLNASGVYYKLTAVVKEHSQIKGVLTITDSVGIISTGGRFTATIKEE